MNPPIDIVSVFDVPHGTATCHPLIAPGGHINESIVAEIDAGPRPVRYLLQRINAGVFPDIAGVMENIERTSLHMAGCSAPRVPALISVRNGGAFHKEHDAAWRMFEFIEGAMTLTAPRSVEDARAVSAAFGAFQANLNDLPGPPLVETIPGFHDTPARYESLDSAISIDAQARATGCGDEIRFAMSQRDRAGAILELTREGVPERIVHNDAKLANVLIDRRGGGVAAVIDLDTVMPGMSLFDFGDMVRSMATAAPEDETDLASVTVDRGLFGALRDGYVETAGTFLTPAEIDRLFDAGLVITLEQGVRFLTDHLAGDRYYRTSRPDHNLERARCQFRIVRSLLEQERELRRL